MLKAKSRSKPRKAAHARAATRKKLSKTVKSVEMSAEEVVSLELSAAQSQRSEQAWLNMTAPPEGEDRWSAIEEHLLAKPGADDHSQRRWKYFAK